MTFVRPWALLLLPAIAGWAAWEWRKTGRRGALILKAVLFCLVAVALSQPKLTVYEQRVALALLADTSVSIPPEDLRKESDLIAKVRTQRGRHNLDVIPFAADIRSLRMSAANGITSRLWRPRWVRTFAIKSDSLRKSSGGMLTEVSASRASATRCS